MTLRTDAKLWGRWQRACLLILGAAMTVSACAAEHARDQDPGPASTGPSCADREPGVWDGDQVCYPLSELALVTVDELTTLWRTEPDTICAYLATDGGSGACGNDLPGNAFYCSVDNEIGWDDEFMVGLYTDFGLFAYVTVIAHEWGHLNQEATGVLDDGRTSFQIEQQADCQAGMFAAFEDSRGLLEMGDVMVAFDTLCEIGGTSGWFDPKSHGSCDERVDAFAHGYREGRRRLRDLCGPQSLELMLEICET